MVSKTTDDVHIYWDFLEFQRNYEKKIYPHNKRKIESDFFDHLKKKFFETKNSVYKGYESFIDLKNDSNELLGCAITRLILEKKESGSFSVAEGCCKDKEELASYLNFLLEDCAFSIIVWKNEEEGKFVIDLEKNL